MIGLREQIAVMFAEVLKIEVPSHDTDLLATGRLDSLGFVELLLELERRFGIRVEMESLEPDHFRSIARIAAFVDAQRRGAVTGLRRDAPQHRRNVGHEGRTGSASGL